MLRVCRRRQTSSEDEVLYRCNRNVPLSAVPMFFRTFIAAEAAYFELVHALTPTVAALFVKV